MRILQASIFYLTIFSCLIPFAAKAQIIPDNSLGEESSIVTPFDEQGVPADVIEGGAARGANLFHSFQEFNVNPDRGAFFNNPEGINNIFSRVTGTNISNINGTLSVLGNANLFLINPNGIAFGENAVLSIQGSFFASTADSFLFEGDSQFSAVNPTAPPLLEVSIPIGARFRDNPGDIVNRSLGLTAFPIPNLALIGGNVDFDGGFVFAPGTNLTLGGLTSEGIVEIDPNFEFTFPTDVTRGDVTLANNSLVQVRGDNGGSVTIHSRDFGLTDGSSLFAGIGVGLGSIEAQAGDIAIDATENVLIDRGEENFATAVENSVLGTGNAGNISITAKNISLFNGGTINSSSIGQGDTGSITLIAEEDITFDGVSNALETESRSGIDSNINSIANNLQASGNAGTIEIEAQNLLINNGGQISSLVASVTNAGNINLTIDDSLQINGSGILGERLVSSEISSLGGFGEGNSGNINIDTNSLSISNLGTINVGTLGAGAAGDITINAVDFVEANEGRIRADVLGSFEGIGGNIQINTSRLSLGNESLISADVEATGESGNIVINATDSINVNRSIIQANISFGASGNGGNLEISTAKFSLGEGAFISADVFGTGNAGNIIINATDFVEASETALIAAGIGFNGEGIGGNLSIDTQRLIVKDEAIISASISGSTGEAGDITINASDSIELFNIGSIQANLSPDSTGEGGNVFINTQRLTIRETGSITATSFDNGNAGNLTVNASESIDLSGGSETARGGLLVNALGSGNGGDLSISTSRLTISNDATINVSNFQSRNSVEPGTGEAGTLEIDADVLELNNGALILAATESGAGGNIDLDIGDGITLENNSNISAQAGTNANGGNLNIGTSFIIAFPGDSNITADAVEGNGGNINISAESLFGIAERPLNPFTNDINASSEFGLQGNIDINNPAIDPTTGLIDLPESVANASDQISQNPCQQGVGSQFIVTGKGGLPPNPTENLQSDRITVDLVEPLPTEGKTSRQVEKIREKDIVTARVPAMGWVFNEKGEVTLTAYSNTDAERERSPQYSTSCQSNLTP